jgi:ATP-dependent RNA helicase DDX52/ROK1
MKRHRNEEEVDGEDANAEDEEGGDSINNAKQSTDPPMPRHRVTAKGNNIPERVDTFEELRDRYHIPSQLMANLTRYGYEYPTGIQSAGCPILLQVSRPSVAKRFSG